MIGIILITLNLGIVWKTTRMLVIRAVIIGIIVRIAITVITTAASTNHKIVLIVTTIAIIMAVSTTTTTTTTTTVIITMIMCSEGLLRVPNKRRVLGA